MSCLIGSRLLSQCICIFENVFLKLHFSICAFEILFLKRYLLKNQVRLPHWEVSSCHIASQIPPLSSHLSLLLRFSHFQKFAKNHRNCPFSALTFIICTQSTDGENQKENMHLLLQSLKRIFICICICISLMEKIQRKTCICSDKV